MFATKKLRKKSNSSAKTTTATDPEAKSKAKATTKSKGVSSNYTTAGQLPVRLQQQDASSDSFANPRVVEGLSHALVQHAPLGVLPSRPPHHSRTVSCGQDGELGRQPFSYDHRSLSTTTLPLQDTNQMFWPPRDTSTGERAQFDRMSRDMDATIAAIDILNGSEEQDIMHAVENSDGTRPPQVLRNVQSRSALTQNYFSKVWLYANSRLPPHLPPFKVYMPTYPLLCLAAQYSLLSYSHSLQPRLITRIPASFRSGTKASLVLVHPNDTSNTIVIAIRGTHSFVDWAVNLSSAPASPAGFLADSGNMIHTGFLSVAKAMLNPIASRLRSIIADNPSRRNASLLLTGHSAGGAVAALLYAHLATPDACGVDSDLRELRGFLGRVHCITFGSPPVSFLPLLGPRSQSGQRLARPESSGEYGHIWRKSLFFAFINEGDPVCRAGDTSFVRSLLSLYAAPAPRPARAEGSATASNHKSTAIEPLEYARPPVWQVPPMAFSNAGRLVLLRANGAQTAEPSRTLGVAKLKSKMSLAAIGKVGKTGKTGSSASSTAEGVQAFFTTDDQLRGVVFGDPAMHAMRLYTSRIERLAVEAVTAGVFDT